MSKNKIEGIMDFAERIAKIGDKVEACLSESRPTHILDRLSEIGNLFAKTVRMHGLGDGAVGLFRDRDGQAYEIQIRPAKYAQYSSTLGTSPSPETAERKKIAQEDPNRAWRQRLRQT
jgi:hypothetical protein